jgi:hypothetical protein
VAQNESADEVPMRRSEETSDGSSFNPPIRAKLTAVATPYALIPTSGLSRHRRAIIVVKDHVAAS